MSSHIKVWSVDGEPIQGSPESDRFILNAEQENELHHFVQNASLYDSDNEMAVDEPASSHRAQQSAASKTHSLINRPPSNDNHPILESSKTAAEKVSLEGQRRQTLPKTPQKSASAASRRSLWQSETPSQGQRSPEIEPIRRKRPSQVDCPESPSQGRSKGKQSAGRVFSKNESFSSTTTDGDFSDLDLTSDPLASRTSSSTSIESGAGQKRPLDSSDSEDTPNKALRLRRKHSARFARQITESPSRLGGHESDDSEYQTASEDPPRWRGPEYNVFMEANRPPPIPHMSVPLRSLADPPPAPKQAVPSLDKIFEGDILTHLETNIIAHDKRAVQLFDRQRIARGVQFQLALGVNRKLWTWDQVKDRLRANKFAGSNEDVMPKISQIMLDKPTSIDVSLKIGKELDREQEAILEDKGRGLGPSKDDFCGNVQQIAIVVEDKKTGRLSVVLEPMESRRSHRIARDVGSCCLIHLKVPDKLLRARNEPVRKFLSRRFILNGRVFVPIPPKDGSLYLLEVNSDFERSPGNWCGDQFRLSYDRFVDRFNAIGLNSGQVFSKYLTRFGLSMSTSVPIIEFDPMYIYYIDDIYPEGLNVTTAATENILTDGCGLINKTAMAIIADRIGYFPCAVQGRIAGCKGLWLVDFRDESDVPKIWIRTSQRKAEVLNPSRQHFIFDLLHPSGPSSSELRLASQSIINLSHNGVPHNYLVEKFRNALQEVGDALMVWDQPLHLIQTLDNVGRVSYMCATRHFSSSEARALGVSGRDFGATVEELDEAESSSQLDVETSLQGTSPEEVRSSRVLMTNVEKALKMIKSGMLPDQNGPLRDSLGNILESHLLKESKKFRIPVWGLDNIFVAPDPYSLLEEDQIYFQSSNLIVNPEDKLDSFTVCERELVIGRYPVRLPSDLRKVRAVNRPELSMYKDVVLVSVKTYRSIMSTLSGGDCDGDTLFLILEKTIVNSFINPDLILSPPKLMDHFERQVETVPDFLNRVSGLSLKDRGSTFLKETLRGLVDAEIGLYSNLHETLIWHRGYNHPDTIRLAFIWGILLDSAKSGLRLTKASKVRFMRDLKSTPRPHCFNPKKEKRQRPVEAGLSFILDDLLEAGEEVCRGILDKYNARREQLRVNESFDEDLAHPYLLAKSKACICGRYHDCRCDEARKLREKDLRVVTDEVNRLCEEWRAYFTGGRRRAEEASGEDAEDVQRMKQAQKFKAGLAGKLEDFSRHKRLTLPTIDDPKKVAISYAWRTLMWNKFALEVGFETSRLIKATACGGTGVTLDVDQLSALSRTTVKMLNVCPG